MRAFALSLLVLAVVIGVVFADVYLQGAIKGSNNRFVETSATRNQNNRIFNSQNNARGGCNLGQADAGANSASNYDYDFGYNTNVDPGSAAAQYKYADTYYEGSEIVLAWTNQHGCGGNPLTDPHNNQCNIVLQYTCDTVHEDRALDTYLHDGRDPNQAAPNSFATDCGATRTRSLAAGEQGIHESRCWYQQCAARQRNKGLFTADQTLNADRATHTRQNPGGGRSGMECEEEREYYPYWTPSPWRDIAYLSSELQSTNIDPCKMVAENTQNTQKKYKCVGDYANGDAAAWKAITAEECLAAGGEWKGYSWNIPAPECKEAPWSRDNHLGASREGFYTNYTWTVPSLKDVWSGDGVTAGAGDYAKCVVRIRYNITTSDYDPWKTFSESNGKENSPVTNDPTVAVGGSYPLQLAINTAQFGRTFQDRTHVFTIRRRPADWSNKRIVNLNLIGKRCNIVECYPAVEYYWIPTTPQVKPGDLVHVQWTGSNTHNNGPNGGDGQTGDSGTGRGGSDHHNFVLTKDEASSFPIPLDKFQGKTLWDQSTCYRPSAPSGTIPASLTPIDCAVTMATSGFYNTKAMTGPGTATLESLLNEVGASFVGGMVIEPKESAIGKHYFMSMRDNNFTNRDQKGYIEVMKP